MNYSVTGFEMILQRKMSFYIVTYYLPSGLFVVVSWISFLVNPEVIPGRMTLLVTIFLVLINIFNTIQTNSPKAEGLTGKYIRLCRHSAPDSLYFVHCGILKLSYFNKYLQNDPIQPWFWNACESSTHNTQHLYKSFWSMTEIKLTENMPQATFWDCFLYHLLSDEFLGGGWFDHWPWAFGKCKILHVGKKPNS